MARKIKGKATGSRSEQTEDRAYFIPQTSLFASRLKRALAGRDKDGLCLDVAGCRCRAGGKRREMKGTGGGMTRRR